MFPSISEARINTTARSVTLSWNSLTCLEQKGPLQYYRIQYVQKTNSTCSDGLGTMVQETVDQFVIVDDLKAHTPYCFRVSRVNVYLLVGRYSSWVERETDEDGE